jgi:hypothetical protein
MSSKKKGVSEEFKKAARFIKIWVVLFVLSVAVVGVILYQGLVVVPFSATYLTNFDNLDLVKRWDDFKTDQPPLDPTILSSPYLPEYRVWVNVSETGLLEEIVRPKTVVSFHVSVRTEFLDKSILKLQSLLVLVLDQNEKVRGKLYTQQFSPDLFLSGKNETDYTFWLRVPADMQNQKYTIIVELFGVIDTYQSISYQRLAEDSHYLERDYGIYGRVPSWSYQSPNVAYFRFLAYDRTDSHTPTVYSILSLAGYSLSLAGVTSTLITLLIGIKDRSKEFWKKSKLYVMFCILFLVLFLVILLLVGLIL